MRIERELRDRLDQRRIEGRHVADHDRAGRAGPQRRGRQPVAKPWAPASAHGRTDHLAGERILIIDADLQDPPELLPEMWRIMDHGVDVVYRQRRSREGETVLKLATASLFYRLTERLADVPLPRDVGDFRLMSRRALDVLLAMPERHRFIRGMVSWIGFRQEPLIYDRAARFVGTTKYPFRKMLSFAADAITSFSIKPLALASWLGIASGLLAVVLVFYSLVSWLGWFGQPAVTGWTSLMAAVAFLGSVQLLVLGIFGEYLGRIYEQSKNRPLFIIEHIVRSGLQASNEIVRSGLQARSNEVEPGFPR